eukprot:1661914-Rhodomonas_salina.2
MGGSELARAMGCGVLSRGCGATRCGMGCGVLRSAQYSNVPMCIPIPVTLSNVGAQTGTEIRGTMRYRSVGSGAILSAP